MIYVPISVIDLGAQVSKDPITEGRGQRNEESVRWGGVGGEATLKKSLFPVQWPGENICADLDLFFFAIFEKLLFFWQKIQNFSPPPPKKKKKKRKKRKKKLQSPEWP